MKRNCLWVVAFLAGVPVSLAFAPTDAATASASSPVEEPSLEALTSDPAARRAMEKWERASRDLLRKHLPSVAARSDAGSLLAATLLWPEIEEARSSRGRSKSSGVKEPRQAWFETAVRMRPRDPTVAWVQVSDCPVAKESCDAKAALDFLLHAEPNNAAVQLLAMTETEDSDAAEGYWQAAAASSVYDTHAREIGAWLHAAMEDATMPPFDPQLAETLGVALGLDRAMTPRDARNVHALAAWMALAIPTFKPITDRCKPQEGTTMDVVRKAQCEKVLMLLADDQSIVIAPMIGLTSMVKLDGDTAQGMASRERLRQLYWVYENAFPDRPGDGPTSAFPGDYAEIVLLEGEVQAMRRVLESKSLPAVAPAGWLPSSERARALVTTGRAPQS
jgi:hypothetical protein